MASRRELEALIVLAGRVSPTLQNALRQTQRGIGGISSSSSIMGKTINKSFELVAKTAAIGTAAIGAGLTYIGVKGTQLASDLSEVQNVVDTTFGQNSKTIDAWSQTALKSFGLSELSAKQFSSTMGAMLKSSGLSADSTLTMSKNLTALSGDMASFYNLDPTEAFEKIRSGISGETEPLRQLGINMSVANLEAYALSKGIKTSYSKMDQASQIALRYNYLLSVSKDAQGDFAKTQGSFANQTRIAKESLGQLSAKIMNAALPGLTKLLQFGNKLLDGAMGNPQFIQKFQDIISSAMDKIIAVTPGAIDFLSQLGPPIKTFYDFGVDSYNFINDNWPLIAPIIGGVTGALVALEIAAKAAFIIEGLTKAWGIAKFAMDAYAVSSSAAAVAQELLNLAWKTSAVGVIVTAVGLLIAGGIAIYQNWDKITALFSGLWEKVSKVGAAIGKFFGMGDKSVNLQTNYKTTTSAGSNNFPNIPMYATGGFTNQPSIFGEAGPEAAIPIKYKNPRSLSLLNQTAKAIGADGTGNSSMPPLSLVFNFYGPVNNKDDVAKGVESSSEYIKQTIEDLFEEKRRVSFG